MPDNWISSDDARELVQIAGLIRFSCPFKSLKVGGFRWRFDSVEAQLEAMYTEERMELRFRYFEKLCLHTLKRQTDKNFTIGVMVGEDMPERYGQRLEGLLADLPQAKIIAMPVMSYKWAIKRAFDQLFDPDIPFRLSFRLDDDDAVAVDFIEQVSGKIPHLLAMAGAIDPIALSFLRRITLLGEEGRRLIESVDGMPNGIGLCVLAPTGSDEHAYSHIHNQVQRYMPTLTDSRPLMNLRTYHSGNDSKVNTPRLQVIEKTDEDLKRMLYDRFDLDVDEILAL